MVVLVVVSEGRPGRTVKEIFDLTLSVVNNRPLEEASIIVRCRFILLLLR